MAGTIKTMVWQEWIPSSGKVFPFPQHPAAQETTTTGDNSVSGEMNLTTSPATVPLGSAAVGGEWIVENPNATGNVILDGDAAGSAANMITIPPGKTYVFAVHADNSDVRASISAGTGIMRYRVIDA
jgi:hypothetical protein